MIDVLAWVGIGGSLVANLLGVLSYNLARRSDRRDAASSFDSQLKSIEESLRAHEVRIKLMGLNRLAHMIDNEKDDRQFLIDHFCGFLRDSCSDAGENDGHRLWTGAVGILRARLLPRARVSWRGAEFDLAGLVLPDTDLRQVDLTGTTLLFSGAHVCGTVRLEGAVFGPDCLFSLRGASLQGGRLLFSAADFQAGQVDLQELRLDRGVIDLSTPRRWHVPPLLDAYSDRAPAGLLMPSVPSELREVLRHPKANVSTRSARADRALREQWGIPDDEELLGLLHGMDLCRIIFTSRKVMFIDRKWRVIKLPYQELGDVCWRVHEFNAAWSNDQAGGSEPSSDVEISFQNWNRNIYMQFGHPAGNGTACSILWSVKHATASLAPLQVERTVPTGPPPALKSSAQP